MIQHPSAITLHYDQLLDQIITEVIILPAYTNPKEHENLAYFRGLWDTGAQGSVIDKRIAQQLQLTPVSIQNIVGIGGTIKSNVYVIDVVLRNSIRMEEVEVTEAEFEGFEMLIGMDLIGLGDFAITNHEEKTTFSFCIPSIGSIDFEAAVKKLPRKRTRRKNTKFLSIYL